MEENNEPSELTDKDFMEFLSATGDERWKILLAHAERNKKTIKIRRLQTMEQNEQSSREEIGKEFEEFCRTKGIAAKFKVAFSHMAESARKQKVADKAQFEEVRRRSAEENAEFTEFLHTKGIKAKVRLIIQNIKNGAKESNRKTRAQIAEAKHGAVKSTVTDRSAVDYSAAELTREFNEYLRSKGLDGKYIVEVTEENDD